MYSTILLPLALDQGIGHKSFQIARKLKSDGGKIIAVHVLDQVPRYAQYYVASDNKEEIHEAAKLSIMERIGNQDDAEAVVLTGHPGHTITEYAEKIGADCIVVGSHKPGL